MMKQNHNSPRWSFGLVLRKKPIKFAALTLFFTVALVALLDPVVTKLVRGMGIQSNAPGALFLALFLAVSIAASGLLLKVLSNARLASMDPAEAQKLFEKQCRFYWRRAYSVAIGYLLWCALEFVFFQFVMPSAPLFPVQLAAFLIPFAAAHLIFTGFNALMVRLTGTNQELIAAFKAGRYANLLPASCRDRQSLQGILRILETAEAGSIRGAILLYRVKRMVVAIYRKLARIIGRAALVTILIALLLGLQLSNFIDREIEANIQASRRAYDRDQLAKKIADQTAAKVSPRIESAVSKQISARLH